MIKSRPEPRFLPTFPEPLDQNEVNSRRGEGQVAKFECLVTKFNGHHGRQRLNVKEANLLFGFRPSLDLKWGPQRNTKKKTRIETEKRGETGNENTVNETVIKIMTKTRIKKGGGGKTEQKRSEVKSSGRGR